jgi:hypothetical protein
MQHVIVFAEEDRFAGWPANNGLWVWQGTELLVGFTTGGYRVQPGHNIVMPYRSLLARSQDGGETWQVEESVNFVGRSAGLAAPSTPIDFSAPGFALRVFGTGYHGCEDGRGGFFFSNDKGRSWQGPYALAGLSEEPALQRMELTPRTDYLVEGKNECLLFLSARHPDQWGDDRVFCARTHDGGRTFHFVSWLVGPADPYRAVMPSSVRGPAQQQIVTALRRRQMGTQQCWLDAYGSDDGGQNWRFLSKIDDTGPDNGNPPALLCLADGRLCCVYGQRSRRQILARYSRDGGQTWSDPQVLREGYHSLEEDADLGYPRLAQRSDGQLTAIYYWACRERPHQHIAATIWAAGGSI